MKGQG